MNNTPLLKINNLTVTYPLNSEGSDVLKALDNTSLKVNSGQIIGIVGESGAGKSTMVRLSWVFSTHQQNLLVVKLDFLEIRLLV